MPAGGGGAGGAGGSGEDQQAKMAQEEEQRRTVMSQILSSEARERRESLSRSFPKARTIFVVGDISSVRRRGSYVERWDERD